MSTFHVFVEGALEPGDVALEQLATAMSARYGLPAAELVTRMKRGRFRVKANIDRATADTYVKDLRAIGARAVVEEGRLQSQPSMQVPNLPMTPPAGTPVVEAPVRNSAPQFMSGLSAAFAPSEAKMDLGALGGDHQTFNLSSIDGETVGSSSPPPPSVEPRFTPSPLPASVAPAKFKTQPTAPPPSSEPIDMFAPPDSEAEAELKVDLAPDELEFRARKTSIPPTTVPMEPIASTSPAMRRGSPSQAPTNAPGSAAREAGFLADTRKRMVLGVLLAIAIGFIPAHFVAAMREKSAFAAIDERVVATMRSATTDAELSALDDYRATELANKRSSRRNIALVSMLIWAVVGAGAGYVWFRRIPWDRS